jgi:hypothetical protein
MMDPLAYFGSSQAREAFLAELRTDQENGRPATGDYPVAVAEAELQAAIEALSASAGKRSDAALDPRLLLGLRAIVRAKYRPVLPLQWNKESGNHLPDPKHLKTLGLIEEGGRTWGEILQDALKAPIADRNYPLEEIFRQVARVERGVEGAMGTAWPLHIEKGLIWITNRHVVAEERSPWYFEVSDEVWEPTDDISGKLNCNAVEKLPEKVPEKQQPRPFKVADVAPRSTYDIAALNASVPGIAGLDIVWDPEEIARGKDLKEALRNRLVLAIGHPIDPRGQSDANVSTVFKPGSITKKHLMPGRLLAKPFGKHAGLEVLLHDCSTIAGTSGSCIIDLGPADTNYKDKDALPPTFGKVIGVHFFGIENRENHAVPSWKLKDLF